MERFNVISKDELEYEILVYPNDQGTVYELLNSGASYWTHPHQSQLKIIDTEDGFIISPKIKKEMDYSQFCKFLILSTFIKNYDSTLMSTYDIFESTSTIQV